RERGEPAALGGGGDLEETGEQTGAVDTGVGERRDVQIEVAHADSFDRGSVSPYGLKRARSQASAQPSEAGIVRGRGAQETPCASARVVASRSERRSVRPGRRCTETENRDHTAPVRPL